MKCLTCGEQFNEPRLLKDLFRVKKFYICQMCIKRYPFEIQYNVIPLKNHSLNITSLFKNTQKFNFDGYIVEYSNIYQKIIKECKNDFVLFFDYFILDDKMMKNMEYISTLLNKDIVILTNIFVI